MLGDALSKLKLGRGSHEEPASTAAQQRAKSFYRLVVRAACKRAWSMSVHDVAPRSFAGLLHKDLNLARQCRDGIRSDFEAVTQALTLSKDPSAQTGRQSACWLLILRRSFASLCFVFH